MSPTKNMSASFRRSRLVLRGVMIVLVLLALREFGVGFMEGFREASRDLGGHVGVTEHGGLSLDAMDVSLFLFFIMAATMVSILKEFEAGRYFTESVLRKTFRMGLITEITCYVLLPLLALYKARNSGLASDPWALYFMNINYIGGVAGTFIRYLSRLFLIGRELEETNELTV